MNTIAQTKICITKNTKFTHKKHFFMKTGSEFKLNWAVFSYVSVSYVWIVDAFVNF